MQQVIFMELTLSDQVLLSTFVVTIILGAVVNKTNFCTMGAVSDVVNIGDSGRMRAWVFAMVIAIVGVMIIESLIGGSLDSTLPPYRTPSFAWLRYIVGGVMFGIGMTLGSGCGNKTLVRLGAGNLKSIIMLLVIGFFAYLMTKTDFYGIVFYPSIKATTIDLAQYGINFQDLGALIAAGLSLDNIANVRLIVGGVAALVLLWIVLRSRDFRGSFDNILGGSVVGLVVVAGWYITAGPTGQAWIEEAEWLDDRPINIAAQSFTFINPMGESLSYVAGGFNPMLLSFGVVAVGGVIVGSFLYSVLTRNFRVEWFSSVGDFVIHVIGGTLMGIGGVLAMGCTIGQGITGISTLSLGSILAFGSIVLGSALTMKFQYYRMLYEAEATVGKALVTALVDLHLLPAGMRKLEAL
ncbi:Lipocalin-related protein and Bos/Can/Equ allergen [hydrothermal vent metagenome]|uniref:Lipocalin-related protein and Bos/Can/Equ allergen n=1 Tax=hydrothermal vent metagenome TaxID=652676 RepID=A0A3B0XYQ8_9ZZZZ